MAYNIHYVKCKKCSKKEVYKELINIHTSYTSQTEDETLLTGQDEEGNELTINFSTRDLIEWIDKDWLKECYIKYLQKL